jgi:hypothetical protein
MNVWREPITLAITINKLAFFADFQGKMSEKCRLIMVLKGRGQSCIGMEPHRQN